MEVPVSAFGTYFDLATRFYESDGYRMLQIAWPDKAGTFSWQNGVDPVVQAVQPVL